MFAWSPVLLKDKATPAIRTEPGNIGVWAFPETLNQTLQGRGLEGEFLNMMLGVA